MEVIVLEPWNQLSYEEALRAQREYTSRGRAGWLLFCCKPTITLGHRAPLGDVLISSDVLKSKQIDLVRVDRGGQVTYHGPGQIIGFPFGTLQDHTGNSRGVKAFAQSMIQTLSEFIQDELSFQSTDRRVDFGCEKSTAGVWVYDHENQRSKIVSIGFRVSKQGIHHGFALNVLPLESEFSWIHPCGEKAAKVTSIFLAAPCDPIEVRNRLARKLSSTKRFARDVSSTTSLQQ